ncbi:hypothetical protein DMP06_03300 [Slackia equolifaciens]|uniref:DEAD/DEAH box helicase n=1 Tax=Slackia equolifaciens TaxID=498718 RepID=A0A3N0B1P4_9ACTN|nr:DEAD/DEAH box helicase [Slackia equolifaciens]RNL41032.1 hypothetical protein DMP06_03300 [Slackia equolifaciens]
MTQVREFNPIEAARMIEDSYREYIATTIHFDDPGLQRQLESILNKEGYLAKGPFLEAAPPYCRGKSVRDLVTEGVLCQSMLSLGGGDPLKFDCDRPLYVHQVKAIRKAFAGKNYAVVTGTGSGKTECFLLPILNDILSEFEVDGSSSGVRAMILYPMNALANDQLKRLRELLDGTKITFGRYTGDTEEFEQDAIEKWKRENPNSEKLPNEIISREEIRKNPPNILLTNYAMLEYLLLRPSDAPLFGGVLGSNWRHLAIDEAHVYSGSLGTEIAYLIRRLKARIESETGERPALHCYATSATIGTDSDEDKSAIAQFASDLFGEVFDANGDDVDVITSERDLPELALDDCSWGMLPLKCWDELRNLLLDDADGLSSEDIRAFLSSHSVDEAVLSRLDGETPLLGLGKVLLGEESTARLVKGFSRPLDLTNVSKIKNLGIQGLDGSNEGIAVLTSMVEVLSAAQRSEGVPILSSRYHSFLRAPEGLYINLYTKQLDCAKLTSELCDGYDVPVYEVSVCRHCGQAYILGTEKSDREHELAWLNPRHEGTDADDDFIPRLYYRILPTTQEADESEEVYWLCPVCGSLHDDRVGERHLFPHVNVDRIPIAKNKVEEKTPDEYEAKCLHCGYASSKAIQPMRVSPEAAGSVVCYDLVRSVPPFDVKAQESGRRFARRRESTLRGGSAICFSDKRQDAAFFAPAMDRTYRRITIRQIIREAVESESDGSGQKYNELRPVIESLLKNEYPQMGIDNRRQQASAWILDELSAEDSRNSLWGLGVVRVEPTEFIEGFSDPDVQDFVCEEVEKLRNDGLGWITPDDYRVFALVCLETLRKDNGIEVPEGVDVLRENHQTRGNWIVEEAERGASDCIRFVGLCSGGGENARSGFIRKYAARVRACDNVSREDAATILQSLYSFMYEYLFDFFRDERFLGERSTAERFVLSPRVWTFYPHKDDDKIYRCDKCGCDISYDTHGVCPTTKCAGHMQAFTYAEARDKDRYYKEVYQQRALPIRIEEHTAQLSSERAREIQAKFISGEVNILSCTTTFELGVDVGDLRAIFMRNVPPSAANYAQRAGRVGRRAGKPGYAVTFARLRPHDIAYFEDPRSIIAGETSVPACYLSNDSIARRHVFAIALSEYFRYAFRNTQRDLSKIYDELLSLDSGHPSGLDDIKMYLHGQPQAIAKQLGSVFSNIADVCDKVNIEDWGWVDKDDSSIDAQKDSLIGRLQRMHDLKHDDFKRLQLAIDQAIAEERLEDAGGYKKRREALRQELTISVLAENGVLPKYGFPTDLVELHLPAMERSINENELSLSRGLRQAIREYAPGNEVVADKRLWKCVGIRKPSDQVFMERRFGKCSKCKSFVWPIEDGSTFRLCPSCGREHVELDKIMIVPSYGFIGEEVKGKRAGERKPRSRGHVEVYFSQHWPEEALTNTFAFNGGTVHVRYASNGQLCALNNPKNGFRVCEICGAAARQGERFEHLGWCANKRHQPKHYHALGAAFVSDVLELVLDFQGDIAFEDDEECSPWESLMWAVVAAASQLLQVPETELGGTVYRNSDGGTSMLIYDNVPGGAGHARQLAGMVEELLHKAYHVVDGHCGCDSCCYGCIANYYNQGKQNRLSRKAALDILEQLFSGTTSIGNETCEDFAPSTLTTMGSGFGPTLHLIASSGGVNYGAMDFVSVCKSSVTASASEEWTALINDLCHMSRGIDLEMPEKNIGLGQEGEEEVFASLLWRNARVALFDEEGIDDLIELFGDTDEIDSDWTMFTVGNCSASDILDALRGID